MIKYPFAKKENRTPLYLWISIVISFVLATACFKSADYRPDQAQILPSKPVMYCIYSILITYFFVSIYSIFYALKRLCKSSISKETVKLVLLRHVLHIVGFSIANLYLIVCILYMVSPDWYFTDSQEDIMFFVKAVFVTQGIYMPLLRFSEPFFFHVVK